MKVSLAALRVNAGYTQAQVCRVIKTTPRTLSKWEAGQTDPPIKKVEEMCKLYKCTIDDIRW